MVSGVKPKNILKLRDAWATAPVAANMLVSIAKLLMDSDPRLPTRTPLAIPKLETQEGGARPWPEWAFGLIDAYAAPEVRRAVWLARYTGQRQADVIRMSKADLEEGGVKVKQRTGKELSKPPARRLKEEMRGWEVTPPGRSCKTPRASPTTLTDLGRPGRD